MDDPTTLTQRAIRILRLAAIPAIALMLAFIFRSRINISVAEIFSLKDLLVLAVLIAIYALYWFGPREIPILHPAQNTIQPPVMMFLVVCMIFGFLVYRLVTANVTAPKDRQLIITGTHLVWMFTVAMVGLIILSAFMYGRAMSIKGKIARKGEVQIDAPTANRHSNASLAASTTRTRQPTLYNGHYWFGKKNGRAFVPSDGPYCTACFDGNEILMRLIRTDRAGVGAETGMFWTCPSCKQRHEVRDALA